MPLNDASRAGSMRNDDLNAPSLAQQYAALVESTDGAILTASLDGTMQSWPATAQRMYGLSANQALGKPFSLIAPTDGVDEITDSLRSIAAGERLDLVETLRVRADKTQFRVSANWTAIRDASGRVIGVLAVERELGESRNPEQLAYSSRAALADAQAFLDKAERLSRTGSWILRLGTDWSMVCSHECYRALGLDVGTPISVELFFSLVHPDDRERVEAAMMDALSGRRPYEVQYRVICRDGSTKWVHAWGEAEYDDAGAAVRVLGVAQDITERYVADETLRASELRFRLLAENARDLIFRIALFPEPHFEYVSPASLAITGYTPDEVYQRPSLATRLVTRGHVLEMRHAPNSAGSSQPIDIEIRRKDNSTIWVSQRLTLIRDDAGTLIAVEGIDRDITERRRAEKERAYAGLHDELTGLPNGAMARNLVDLARARASANGRSVVVVALDLDDLPVINDTHGHEAGDAVLIGVAEMLKAAFTDRTSVARTGSHEFALIGDDIGGNDDTAAFVTCIQNALLQPVRHEGADIFVHAHLGVSVDEPTTRPESHLRNASTALAHARKERAGLGVAFHSPEMRQRTDDRLALVSDLHRALERNEFELRYQPIVRLSDDMAIGVEALIRWRRPERGLVSPADFIMLAEDTGLIIEIGAWVLNEACTQLRRFADAGGALGQLGISVNVSVKQLVSAGILQTVDDAIRRAGIPPGRLTIEMTESVFAEDLEAIRDVLSQLRTRGIRIAIDDFGTGYSSLAYLRYLPLDTLKIDKNFVDGIEADTADATIVASAVSISRALGLLTVAEGVETAEQAAALLAIGCDAGQGYYFSKPVTNTEIATLLDRRAGAPWQSQQMTTCIETIL